MGIAHKRTDLQRCAQCKLDDAIFLLGNRRFSNAYYLAGYALEIGLKACISRQIVSETIPDPEFVKRIYIHELPRLVGFAGLTEQLQKHQASDKLFAEFWGIVTEWNESVRYSIIEPISAQAMLTATTHPQSGVMQWIKTYW